MDTLELKILLASLVLVVVGQVPLVSACRDRASLLLAPLRYGTFRVGRTLKAQVSFWFSLDDVFSQNQKLREDVLSLESEVAGFKEVKRENEELRRNLSLEVEGKPQLLAAKVSGWEDISKKGTLLVDKGGEQGVAAGMPVLFGNYLLGKVVEVRTGEARVRLLTDPNFRVFALDQDSPDRARGVVRGYLPGRLRMERILPEERVGPGDQVITSGEGGEFPSGLLLGRVERVEEGDILKQAILKLPIDFSRLTEVFILKAQ